MIYEKRCKLLYIPDGKYIYPSYYYNKVFPWTNNEGKLISNILETLNDTEFLGVKRENKLPLNHIFIAEEFEIIYD